MSNGPTLENKLQGMYVKGKSKLAAEVTHCQSIAPRHRKYYTQHVINEDGEGEPHELGEEIIICEKYDAKNRRYK